MGGETLENETLREFDPVCGMEFLPGHPHHILAIGVDGRVFHFCSDACRQKFQADPDRYVIGRVGQPEDFAEAAEIDGAEGQGS